MHWRHPIMLLKTHFLSEYFEIVMRAILSYTSEGCKWVSPNSSFYKTGVFIEEGNCFLGMWWQSISPYSVPLWENADQKTPYADTLYTVIVLITLIQLFWFIYIISFNPITDTFDLSHLFPMHSFSTLWKHQKTLRFFMFSGGRQRARMGNVF